MKWILVLMIVLLPLNIFAADRIITPPTTVTDDFINFHYGILIFDQYFPLTEIYSNNIGEFTQKILEDDIVGKYIKQQANSEPIPTPWWVNLYGMNVIVCDNNCRSLLAGDIVVARAVEGIACGKYRVKQNGIFGFMPIYKDDPYSNYQKEGPIQGEQFYLYLNGLRCDNTLTWTEFGQSIKIDTLYVH